MFVIDCQEKMFVPSMLVPNDSAKNDDTHTAEGEETLVVGANSVQAQVKQEDDAEQGDVEMGEHGASPSQPGNLKSPFHVAMQMVAQFMGDKIIQGGGDLLGTVLYNVGKKKNQFDFENIHVLHDMDIPDASRIQQAETLSEMDGTQIEELLGKHNRSTNFHEVLWCCQHLFSHVPKNVGYKRVFLLTCDEDPIDSNEDLRKKVQERVRDLADSEIMLDLFVLGMGTDAQERFRHGIFWQHIIPKDEDEDEPDSTLNGMYFNAIEQLQELKRSLKCRAYRKRGLLTFPLILGGSGDNNDDAAISVTLYNQVMRSSKPKFTWLHADTNRPIRKLTMVKCAATGQELMSSDISYCYDYGGERVRFEREELVQLKTLGSQGSMRLIGFKPRSRLKVYHNMRSSGFIYPNENRTQGSTNAFAALHRKMLEMDKMAICRFTPRRGSMPAYVALLPQEHLIDESGEVLDSNGFHVIYLPNADGIRKLNLPVKKAAATRQQIDAAKDMINKLRTEYDVDSFYNPALQKQYAHIQSMALDKSASEASVADYTLPHYEDMDRYKSYVHAFRDAVFPSGYQVGKKSKATSSRSTAAGTKRKRAATVKKEQNEDDENDDGSSGAGSSRGGRSSKRRKVKQEEAGDDAESEEIDMVQLAKDGKLNKLTVPVLREFCSMYKIKIGRKQELIDNITEFLRKKGKI